MIPLLFGVFSVTALHAQPAENQSSPLSVCQLIEHRSEFSGHIVTVRDEVKAGGHGPYLVAAAGCQYKLITRGVGWPNIIYLTYPDNRANTDTLHANFKVDWSSIRKAEDDERDASFNSDTDRVFRTYTGLFVTYRDLENRVSPGVAGAIKLGFGPVGLEAPAQLLIKSVRDVIVIHGKRQ